MYHEGVILEGDSLVAVKSVSCDGYSCCWYFSFLFSFLLETV